jgi:hypothetical protein
LGHPHRRGIAAFNGVPIDLDGAPGKIDNPDLGYAKPRVDRKLCLPVMVQGAVRDFGEEQRVGRPGMGGVLQCTVVLPVVLR